MRPSILYVVVNSFLPLALGGTTQPTGSQLIWEFVNCVEDSTGYQSAEAWGWSWGNLPGPYANPNSKYKVHEGGPYYWEGQTSTFYNAEGNRHEAYIFSNANTNNGGPQGIQVSQESSGLWAWYGSGWLPRLVGSGYTCNSVYWSMELPHAILQTTFSGTQGICEYSGDFGNTMNSVGLSTNSLSGPGSYSFTNTGLYAQSSCCSGSCCACSSSCGGEIGNNVNIGLTGAAGELQTMLARLKIDGQGKSSSTPCNCNCPSSGCFAGSFGNTQCPAQPPPGYSVPQNGLVAIIYGPFTDGSGAASLGNNGEAYLEYQMYEQPPQNCAGGIVATALNILEGGALTMLTGDADGMVGSILANAGTSIANLALQCAGVTS